MNFVQVSIDWFSQPEHWAGSSGIPVRLAEHAGYSALALFLATLIAVPVGLVTGHTGRGGFTAASVANFARALPTMGVLFLVVLLAGIGLVPVMVALVALAVPPILVNTYEGVRGVEPRLRDAAVGMGMRGWEVLFRLEFPVALPLILLGMRTAAIQVVSTATIAAYVGIGGLGRFIVDGQARREFDMVIAGSILVVALAMVVIAASAVARRSLVAPGLRVRQPSGT